MQPVYALDKLFHPTTSNPPDQDLLQNFRCIVRKWFSMLRNGDVAISLLDFQNHQSIYVWSKIQSEPEWSFLTAYLMDYKSKSVVYLKLYMHNIYFMKSALYQNFQDLNYRSAPGVILIAAVKSMSFFFQNVFNVSIN